MATRIWTGAVSGDWGNVGNWHGGVIPVATDDVYLIDNDQDINAGLDQSGVALDSFTCDLTYKGNIGTNSAYLQLDATVSMDFGQQQGEGPIATAQVLRIDTGSTNLSPIRVHNTAAAGDTTTGLPPLLLLCNSATADLTITNGTVGLGTERRVAGSTMQLDTVTIGSRASTSSPTIVIDVDLTLDDLIVYSGTVTCYGSLTNVTEYGGTVTLDTADAITSATINGGTVYLDQHGTISTLIVDGGTVDWSRTSHARTVTNIDLRKGSTMKLDPNVVTITSNVSGHTRTTYTCSAL